MDSLLSQQGFWAVIGTITGAIVVSATNLGIQWWQRRQQRQIATMRVAIELRHWLNDVVTRMFDRRNCVESDGNVGTEYREMPNFRFEDSLDNALVLNRRIATDILDLIHQKDSNNSIIYEVIEVIGDDDESREVFMSSSAQTATVGLEIFRKITKRLKWSDTGISEHAEDMLQREIEAQRIRQEKREKANQAFRQKLFGNPGAQDQGGSK